MSACDFKVFSTFDLGGCLHSIAFGWVPDWVWMLLPYWPWIVVIGGTGLAYRVAGWPGVAAFFGGIGFIVGRRTAPKDDPVEHVTGKDAEPPPPRRRPTRIPPATRRETVSDWFKRVTGQ